MSEAMPEAEVAELLRDAVGCPRLGEWERRFLQDLRARRLHSDNRRPHAAMSKKQSAVLRRIQEKVYAV